MNRRTALAAAACALVALPLLATGSGALTSALPPAHVTISVVDYDFSPHTITLAPGTTVLFINEGHATHRIVADNGAFDSHGLQPGGQFSYRFDALGTFGFHCEIHTRMVGSVVVVADPTAAATTSTTAAAATTPTTAADLAMTGSGSIPLTFVALLFVALGALAISFARRPNVAMVAVNTGRDGDEFLPLRDRARQR